MTFRCPKLPCLPGYNFNPQIGRTKFNMDPKFDFIGEGVPALVEKVKPNMFGALPDKYPSVYPRGQDMEIPAWIAFDRQILCFDAYFQETLREVRNAPFLVRKVKIYYFLEDGTIQVIEPKIENSGVAQGTMICRHKIRLPAPMDDNFYEMIDLNVGKEVEFYGRVFKITNCDKFTRNFLNRQGIPVPDPIVAPRDPYFEERDAKPCKREGTRPVDPLGKFLALDGKVLHFQAYWDDRKTTYGYLHTLDFLYYLCDDTVEIKENQQESCTKTSSFVFLKRAKLPKTFKSLPKPGADAPITLLNVLDKGYVIDPLNCNPEALTYYTEKDLAIGAVINCYGRDFILTDCDNFTRDFYRQRYGVDAFEPQPTPEDNRELLGSKKIEERQLPVWNGYGSFEDSAQNCITVEPKALHSDFKKFLSLDRIGLDSHILRFEGRMISKNPDNMTRQFIISYYLSDDTMSVFEFARRNSGFDSKTFLARTPVLLPKQELLEMSKPPLKYAPQDMFVGAVLNINSFIFELLSADEYALRYMEINCNQYPKSNIQLIMNKVREKLRPIYKDFVAGNLPSETPVMSYEKLRSKLKSLLGDELTEHEMITISRAFPGMRSAEEKYDRQKIRAIVLTELKRFLWDDLTRLGEYLLARDPDRTGKLPKKDCYTLLRACRLPLDSEFLEKILQVIKRDENCNLDYHDLLKFLDINICHLPDVEPINIKREFASDASYEYNFISLIDWCSFNKYLDLEDSFKDTEGKNVEYFKQATQK